MICQTLNDLLQLVIYPELGYPFTKGDKACMCIKYQPISMYTSEFLDQPTRAVDIKMFQIHTKDMHIWVAPGLHAY